MQWFSMQTRQGLMLVVKIIGCIVYQTVNQPISMQIKKEEVARWMHGSIASIYRCTMP